MTLVAPPETVVSPDSKTPRRWWKLALAAGIAALGVVVLVPLVVIVIVTSSGSSGCAPTVSSGVGDEGSRLLETKPIKGTTPRSDDPAVDAAHRERLASDPRYRAENLMIVDLLRHDVASVCEVGSVEVPQLMEVESYATVHQLVSTVRGHLRPDVSTVGALRSLFPAGSMTGAPKLRTMQIIDEVEADPRGVYSGAFGWISGSGAADLGVVIRSAVTTGDGRYVVGTGGGITVLSDLHEEWAESALKAERLLAAFADDRTE